MTLCPPSSPRSAIDTGLHRSPVRCAGPRCTRRERGNGTALVALHGITAAAARGGSGTARPPGLRRHSSWDTASAARRGFKDAAATLTHGIGAASRVECRTRCARLASRSIPLWRLSCPKRWRLHRDARTTGVRFSQLRTRAPHCRRAWPRAAGSARRL